MNEAKKLKMMIEHMRHCMDDIRWSLNCAEAALDNGLAAARGEGLPDGKCKNGITGESLTAAGHIEVARDIMDRTVHDVYMPTSASDMFSCEFETRKFYRETFPKISIGEPK